MLQLLVDVRNFNLRSTATVNQTIAGKETMNKLERENPNRPGRPEINYGASGPTEQSAIDRAYPTLCAHTARTYHAGSGPQFIRG